MNKNVLREKYIAVRRDLTDRNGKNSRIAFYVKQLAEKYKNVYAYFPTGAEADILKAFEGFDGRLFFPVSYEDSYMEFVEYTGETKTGRYGITEPCGMVADAPPDIVFVPGVVFDRSGGRIGYGKGYYDRFLARIDVLKAGVCFDEQMSDEAIECGRYDVKMDIIITQSGIYTCQKEGAL